MDDRREAGHRSLWWLRKPPDNFRQLVRGLRESIGDDTRTLARALVEFDLGCNQLHSLGTVISTMVSREAHAIRLGVLSNGTTDLVAPALAASALRHAVWVQTVQTAFGQVAAEALAPTSEINAARCHFVLLAIDHRGLPFTPAPGDRERAQASVEEALSYIDTIRHGLRSASDCTVIVQTVPGISDNIFGSLESTLPGTMQWQIDRYNGELRSRIASSSDLLLDIARLAETVGLARWHDPTQWTLGKFAFAHDVVPLYADWVGRLIGAARGRARKCLVLDLDNTVWGGVIGDDGLEGIVVGNGNPTGEAFLDVQRTALALRDRGIILAVSSKNDDEMARRPFRQHPEMLLKEEHIAVFQANWQDKASNIKAIARTLDIGLDAIVLLDDNPAERSQVRDALPMVAVPELPSDPALFARTLLAAGYFESISFTPEDRQRAEQYRANAARAEALGAATDLGAYLRSLEMKAVCGPFDRIGRKRIEQLINKSNQFNLTTRRYTESQIEDFEKSTRGLTLQVRLIDRFGDNGMVAVVICRADFDQWIIDTWLMSCRVLNRQLERAMLNYVVSCARDAGVRVVIGQYIETERNGMVREHYTRLGFKCIDEREGESLWQLETDSYQPFDVPIEIVRTETIQASAEATATA